VQTQTGTPAPVEVPGEDRRPDAAPELIGAWGRWGRQVPMIQFLIAIILIPTLALPVFGWSFVRDRLDRSRAAESVARGLEGVLALDEMRSALWTESAGMSLPMFTSLAELSPAQKASIPARMLNPSPQSFFTASDRALARVRRNGLTTLPGGPAAVARVAEELVAARKTMIDAQRNSGTVAGLIPIAAGTRSYAAMVTTLQTLEQAAVQRISAGELGTGSAALLKANAQIRAVTDLSLQVIRQQITYFGLQLVPGGDTALLDELNDANGTVDSLAAGLDRFLSPQLRTVWKQVQANREIAAYRAAVEEFRRRSEQDGPPPFSIDPAALTALMTVASGSIAFSDQLSRMTSAAVEEGVAQATSDRDAARARGQMGLAVTVGVLLATVAVLFLVGGMIRRRLRALADSAQRLSSGRFEPMVVRGPREVAYASEGLNDAVHSLQEITTKAGLLAGGDLMSPALERPSPGPLGAAMHASFERVVQVIREREELQRQLTHQATHDSLTGLPNRAEAETRLVAAVRNAHSTGSRVAVLFIDLDHFKAVNDTFGHQAGDEVLRVTAERLLGQLRATDVVSRLGGDEFVAILEDITMEAAAATGERIVASVRETVPYQGAALAVGASVGIAVWPAVEGRTDGDPADGQELDVMGWTTIAEDLLNRADKAVYRAKAGGRNAAVF
jgi:diguanylate cyclase (GGDEF)-like protein